jgi:hypothetical protein
VTNVERIKTCIEKKAASGLLLKVNQIGTIWEAIQACKMSHDQVSLCEERRGEGIREMGEEEMGAPSWLHCSSPDPASSAPYRTLARGCLALSAPLALERTWTRAHTRTDVGG